MTIQTDDFAPVPAKRVVSAAPTSPQEEALERALRLACRELLTLEQSGASYGLKMPAHTITQASGPAQLRQFRAGRVVSIVGF